MFWRFGFHNDSAIDTLLSRDDVSVEALLEEDDLLQECKAQNTRLINYLQRVDVIRKLLAFAVGDLEDEAGSLKYPFIATEVLCSEIWSIVETCMNHQELLLRGFWNAILDRPSVDFKTSATAKYFAKINSCFLMKKPVEMFNFIRSLPSVIERTLVHIEVAPFVDLLVRVIQLHERPRMEEVLTWLSNERLIPRLVQMLSPHHNPATHSVVCELIKNIITMSAPSPGQPALSEGLQNGPSSNHFARELASYQNIATLISFMLQSDPSTGDDSQRHLDGDLLEESISSSIINAMSVIIELIRKNNSDYFEPFLFHTLRNRLMSLQQTIHDPDNVASRQLLEQAMHDLTDNIGVVHFGVLLKVMSKKLPQLNSLLKRPRSPVPTAITTVGNFEPLTFERLEICELLAELLHCSNMSLLNRKLEDGGPEYDESGRILGGLSALEQLAHVVSSGNNDTPDLSQTSRDDDDDELEPVKQLPVHGSMVDSIALSSPSLNSDDSFSGDDTDSRDSNDGGLDQDLSKEDSCNTPNQAAHSRSSHSLEYNTSGISSGSDSCSPPNAEGEPIGGHFKTELLRVGIMSSLLDLFFQFPWNNILHTVVYDFLHQILITGRTDGPQGQELVVGLFRDAKLGSRILDAHERNVASTSASRHVRLGYMGHLTLISDDIMTALDQLPLDVALRIGAFLPQPAWDDYVTGYLLETKRKEASVLGGERPSISLLRNTGFTENRWSRVDEADKSNASVLTATPLQGQFKRVKSSHPMRAGTADFGIMDDGDSDNFESSPKHDEFTHYLASEISSQSHHESVDDNSDEEEEEDDDGGWLSQSQFDLQSTAPSTGRLNLPNLTSGFEDNFVPPVKGHDTSTLLPQGRQSDSNDSDSLADSFGDFGDFQEAENGMNTPTGSSWTWDSEELLSDNPFLDNAARDEATSSDAMTKLTLKPDK